MDKSQKRKISATDDLNDTEEDTEAGCHDTDSEQLMTNSTGCETGAKRSNVEVVTFSDPLKKNKLSKAVEPGQKVRRICSLRSPLSTKKHFIYFLFLDMNKMFPIIRIQGYFCSSSTTGTTAVRPWPIHV